MIAAAPQATLQSRLAALHAACVACAALAGACAQACDASGFADRYRLFNSLCEDCRDICIATASVTHRFDGGEASSLLPLLRASVCVSAECAGQCAAHRGDFAGVSEFQHACVTLQAACDQLAGALRWRLAV